MPNDANQNVWSTALVNSVSYPVGLVGRPGLDPGTLGLKERYLLSRRSARIHKTCSGEMSRPPSSAENNPVH